MTRKNRKQDYRAGFSLGHLLALSLPQLDVSLFPLLCLDWLSCPWIHRGWRSSIKWQRHPLPSHSPTSFLALSSCTLLMPRGPASQFWAHRRVKPLPKFAKRHCFLHLTVFSELTSCIFQWNLIQQYVTQSWEIKSNYRPEAFFWIRMHRDVQRWIFDLRDNHSFLFIVPQISATSYSPEWRLNESQDFFFLPTGGVNRDEEYL